MRRSALAILALTILVLPACSSMKVYIDWDEAADWDSFQTFKFEDTEEGSLSQSSPLMHERIVNSVTARLKAAGLSEDTSKPDLIITYYTSSEQEISINTSAFGYGYPGSWNWWGGGWGWAGSTATTSTYEVGTLVVDAWDPAADTLVWRGVASSTISQNPEKLAAWIDKAIDRMVDKSRKTVQTD